MQHVQVLSLFFPVKTIKITTDKEWNFSRQKNANGNTTSILAFIYFFLPKKEKKLNETWFNFEIQLQHNRVLFS